MPNAVASYEGCKCLPGYVSDAPIKPRGCWKCEGECNPQAYCDYPGICKCLYKFVGDGVKKCTPPKPYLIRFEQKSDEFLANPISLFYSSDSAFVPFSSMCKFGDSIVAASITPNSSIKCMAPPNLKLPASISLSFDGEEWSNSMEIRALESAREHARIFVKARPTSRQSVTTWKLIFLTFDAAAIVAVSFLPQLNSLLRRGTLRVAPGSKRVLLA